MLEKLHLTNFQCHRDLSLEFDAGVNVIAGTSDVGKSAVLKGLLWLLTNKPQGIGFRSMQAKKGEVVQASILLDEQQIVRRRSEQINEYFFNGLRFVAMKNEVPAPISEFLDLSPVNIQTQFQQHFLLSSSSGDVARTLNESCDLSVIDQTIKRIKGIEQSAKQEAQRLSISLGKTEQALSGMEWVEEAEAKAEALEADLGRIASKKARMQELEKLTLSLQQANTELDTLQESGQVFSNGMPVLDKQMGKLVNLNTKRTKLEDTICRLADVETDMAQIRTSAFDSMPTINDELEDWQNRSGQILTLKSIIRMLKEYALEEKAAKDSLAAVQSELAGFAVCPLCGADMGGRDV